MLESLLDALTPWFEEWGLIIVFIAVFLESSIVVASVLPGESVLLLGGFFASPRALGAADQAPLVLGEVILVAFAGALLGDLVGYLIGRGAGRWLVRRLGRFFFLPPRRLPMMERYFRAYGMRAILVGRFAPFLRSIRTLIAGTVRMPFPRFLLPDVVGAAAWVSAIAATGFLLGESWHVAQRYLGAGGMVVLLVLVIVFALTWRRMGARLERELEAQAPAGTILLDEPSSLAGPPLAHGDGADDDAETRRA